MIKNILKKIYRLFKFNRTLQIKLGACAVLLIATAVQSASLNGMDRSLDKANAEWELVMKVPSMERKLRTKNLKDLNPESQIIAIRNILEGTSFKDDMYNAIIDDEIYSVGDMIGDYRIMNITLKTILLENSEVFDIKELRFPEQPVAEPVQQ